MSQLYLIQKLVGTEILRFKQLHLVNHVPIFRINYRDQAKQGGASSNIEQAIHAMATAWYITGGRRTQYVKHGPQEWAHQRTFASGICAIKDFLPQAVGSKINREYHSENTILYSDKWASENNPNTICVEMCFDTTLGVKMLLKCVKVPWSKC